MELQTLYRHHKKRILLISVLFVLGIGGALAIGDIATKPETTAEQQTLAQQHLITAQLPTPTNQFSHDGCTLWPDKLLGHDFSNACFTHDIAYWAGGTSAARQQADLELYAAISHTGPLGPVIAMVVYSGVRLFGDSIVTRAVGANWGYGYNT